MRKSFILICIILSTGISCAQNNLISNGSFENNTICPNHLSNAISNGSIMNCSNPASESPDYFNSCTVVPSQTFQVPTNGRGSQVAKSGSAYAGIGVWALNISPTEYIQIRIKDSLKPNHHYAFECYLSRAEKFRYAVSNFGAYFSVDSVSMPATDILPFVPQINNPVGNYFTDTLNWMPFTGTFLAQGGEQYVILGNFNPATTPIDTLYQYYGSASHSNWAYYYIDDVSLIDLDSTLAVNENEAMAQVKVFPNPASTSIVLNHYGNFTKIIVEEISGKTVLEANLKTDLSSEIFDVSNLANGIYLIKMQGDSKSEQLKLVINK
jgi:hypothetical protein